MSRTRVDHTYHDYSRYLEEGGEIVKHKKSGANFPAKLHRMLSDSGFSHIITWMPHGRAWKILNKELLISSAVPAHFTLSRFESFTRQLSFWGFKRLYRVGADFGCYYHEMFLQGIPELTVLMKRASINMGKLMPNAQEEPDFYVISESRPLPQSSTRTYVEESIASSTAKQDGMHEVLVPTSHPLLHRNTSDPGLSKTKHAMTHVDYPTRRAVAVSTSTPNIHFAGTKTAQDVSTSLVGDSSIIFSTIAPRPFAKFTPQDLPTYRQEPCHKKSDQILLDPAGFPAPSMATPVFTDYRHHPHEDTYGRAQNNDLGKSHPTQHQPPIIVIGRQQDNTTAGNVHQRLKGCNSSGSYEGEHTFDEDMNRFFKHFEF